MPLPLTISAIFTHLVLTGLKDKRLKMKARVEADRERVELGFKREKLAPGPREGLGEQ